MAPSRPPVLAVGEALVDWVSTERGRDLLEAERWTKAPGGAPLNVAIGLARLGVPVAFAGKLGADPFGDWLEGLLSREGVDTRLATVAPGHATRMAYVTTNPDGDRTLAAFSSVGCADAALTPADLPARSLTGVRTLYFGSLILRAPEARLAVLETAQRVREAGGLVVFDPNWRAAFWPDPDEAHDAIEAGASVSDVLKLGHDELAFLHGDPAIEPAATTLLDRYGLSAVVVTQGENGAYLRTPSAEVRQSTFRVQTLDTTGAGDGFVAALLAEIDRHDEGGSLPSALRNWPHERWAIALRRACAVGALTTTRTGAIGGLPTAQALDAFLRQAPERRPRA